MNLMCRHLAKSAVPIGFALSAIASLPSCALGEAQPATKPSQCLEVPTPLLAALRKYGGTNFAIIGQVHDREAARIEIRNLLSSMIEPQSAVDHNNFSSGTLNRDSPLWSAGATCNLIGPDGERWPDGRIRCELIYYDKYWHSSTVMTRLGGWYVPFDYVLAEGGASLSLGPILNLGKSTLPLECLR